MTRMSSMVVAVGAAEHGRTVLQYAARLAQVCGAREIRVVHVTPVPEDSSQLREGLRALAQPCFAHIPATLTVDVLQGPLTDRLLAYVAELQADLLVVGGRRRVLASRLAMLAPCALAVVPPGAPAAFERPLMALDFSGAATEALRWAASLSSPEAPLALTALHVMTPESAGLVSTDDPPSVQLDRVRQLISEAGTTPGSLVARVVPLSSGHGIGRQHHWSPAAAIQGSDIADTILSEVSALNADALIVSTRGRSRSVSILLGSVTEKIIERSPVPVLVHRAGAPHRLADLLRRGFSQASPVRAN
jgi:nucleotide-binding universal stress UspA family protein